VFNLYLWTVYLRSFRLTEHISNPGLIARTLSLFVTLKKYSLNQIKDFLKNFIQITLNFEDLSTLKNLSSFKFVP